MGWAGRLFDVRDNLVRMVLLDVSGVCYLLFAHRADTPRPAAQWILAMAAFTVAPVLHRRPLVNLAAQTALLAVAFRTVDDVTINQVGASWALLEVVLWARGRRVIWLGAGLLAVVDLTDSIGDASRQVLSGVVGLIVEVGVPVLLGLVIRTSRELAQQAQQRAEEEQRRRESESRAARADERGAIARELHDVLAHHVASMVLRVGVARHVLPDLDPRVEQVFDDVHGTGTAALADLRRLVAVLRDPAGVRGDAALTAIEPAAVPAALGAAVDRARQAGVTVDADIDPRIGSLDAVRGMAVLRLTQEALTNVVKHAGTTARARLSTSVVDGAVHWEVTDDGSGSPPVVVPPGGGHGITGMRERVEVLGGRLTAGPTGTGWRVATVLPASTDGSAPVSAPTGGTADPPADRPVAVPADSSAVAPEPT
ncbi:sensor histidine kinase [Plantactinospora sp. GCM10030261]|uniref:sensor histidine kinase n=1 Tax=Plantactinospora sp. GCM10030261 TaxID=3273420 RepID=UPI00361D77F2